MLVSGNVVCVIWLLPALRLFLALFYKWPRSPKFFVEISQRSSLQGYIGRVCLLLGRLSYCNPAHSDEVIFIQ